MPNTRRTRWYFIFIYVVHGLVDLTKYPYNFALIDSASYKVARSMQTYYWNHATLHEAESKITFSTVVFEKKNSPLHPSFDPNTSRSAKNCQTFLQTSKDLHKSFKVYRVTFSHFRSNPDLWRYLFNSENIYILVYWRPSVWWTGWCKSRGTVCSADCSAVVATRSIILTQNIPKPLL